MANASRVVFDDKDKKYKGLESNERIMFEVLKRGQTYKQYEEFSSYCHSEF